MRTANVQDRENALVRHIRNMPANLLRDYLAEHLTGSEERLVDQFTIVLRAQDKVPAKAFTECNTVPVKQFELIDGLTSEEEEFPDDGEPSI